MFDLRVNPLRPMLRPWIPTEGSKYGSSQVFTAVRNPYFYAVDQEGNQLPYVDRLQYTLVQDNDILQLKAIAGEIDFQGRHVNLAMFPLLKQNEETGNYHMTIWPALTGAEIGIHFNQQWDGPEAQYFENRDFRNRPLSRHRPQRDQRDQLPRARHAATARAGSLRAALSGRRLRLHVHGIRPRQGE